MESRFRRSLDALQHVPRAFLRDRTVRGQLRRRDSIPSNQFRAVSSSGNCSAKSRSLIRCGLEPVIDPTTAAPRVAAPFSPPEQNANHTHVITNQLHHHIPLAFSYITLRLSKLAPEPQNRYHPVASPSKRTPRGNASRPIQRRSHGNLTILVPLAQRMLELGNGQC